MSSRLDCTLALVALLRAFHKECEGCPVEDLCDQAEALVNVAKAAEDIRPYSPDEIRPGASATTYLIPTDRVERLRLSLAVLDKAGGK